jgi:hypothetical protein
MRNYLVRCSMYINIFRILPEVSKTMQIKNLKNAANMMSTTQIALLFHHFIYILDILQLSIDLA